MDSEENKALQEKIFRHFNTRVSEAAKGVRESSRNLFRQIEELSDELGRRVEEGAAEAAGAMAEELSRARDAAAGAAERGSGLARAVSSILEQKEQLSVLGALIEGALHFTDGAVIFVLKGENVGGWRSGGRIEEQRAKTVHFPFVSSNSVVGSLRQREAVCVTGELSRSDRALFKEIGAGLPAGFIAVPLLIRERAQAVLLGANFADGGDAPGPAEVEALKALAAAAMSAIGNIQGRPRREPGDRRPSDSPPRRDRVTPKPTPPLQAARPAEPPAGKTKSPVPPEEDRPQEQVRPKPAPAREPESPRRQKTGGKPRSPWFTPTSRKSSTGLKSAAAEQPGRSAGQFRSKADNAGEKSLSVEEQELHDDARRFARLLVSEIKLYNEAKVVTGRQEKDLYQRLRTDIERSRQMYNERVPPSIAAKTNYFMDELVSILAEGDRANLGM